MQRRCQADFLSAFAVRTMPLIKLYDTEPANMQLFIAGWALDIAATSIVTVMTVWTLLKVHWIDGKKTPWKAPYVLFHLLATITLIHNALHLYTYLVFHNPLAPVDYPVELLDMTLAALTVVCAIIVVAIHHIFLRITIVDGDGQRTVSRITVAISLGMLVLFGAYVVVDTVSKLGGYLLVVFALVYIHVSCMAYLSGMLQRIKSPSVPNFAALIKVLWRSPVYRRQVFYHLIIISGLVILSLVVTLVTEFSDSGALICASVLAKFFFFRQMLCRRSSIDVLTARRQSPVLTHH
jgi:hypothetical protein